MFMPAIGFSLNTIGLGQKQYVGEHV